MSDKAHKYYLPAHWPSVSKRFQPREKFPNGATVCPEVSTWRGVMVVQPNLDLPPYLPYTDLDGHPVDQRERRGSFTWMKSEPAPLPTTRKI